MERGFGGCLRQRGSARILQEDFSYPFLSAGSPLRLAQESVKSAGPPVRCHQYRSRTSFKNAPVRRRISDTGWLKLLFIMLNSSTFPRLVIR